MFKLIPMEPINKDLMDRSPTNPEGNFNPFHVDAFCMGRDFSKDIMFMCDFFNKDKYSYGYFINTKTGEKQQMLPLELGEKNIVLDGDDMISIRTLIGSSGVTHEQARVLQSILDQYNN